MRKSVLPGFMFYIGGTQYCDEALILFNRLTGEQPSTALKELIDLTIRCLIEDGIHQLTDAYYFRGVHTAELACQNWAKNAHNSTLVNSPTFTPKVGFTGNGMSQYIKLNYVMKNDAVNTLINSATVSVLDDPIGSVNFTAMLGTIDTNRLQLFIYTSANESMVLNAPNGEMNYNVNIGSGELLTYTRSISNLVQGYKDGIPSGNAIMSTPVGYLSKYDVFELSRNNANSPLSFYNGTRKFSLYGGFINPQQVASLNTRVKNFYNNIGSTF